MHKPSDAFQGSTRPVDRSRPCWTCHWYGYMTSHGAMCVRPMAPGYIPQSDTGCCYWEREPGADDEGPGQRPAPDNYRSAYALARHDERQRLDKIWKLCQRVSMPDGVYLSMKGRSGYMTFHVATWFPPSTCLEAEFALARTGVNQAIRAGNL